MTNYLDLDELRSERAELNDRVNAAVNGSTVDSDQLDEDEFERLNALDDLFDELPPHVRTLIPESEFADYARDEAEELTGDDASFLFSYVDWARLAANMIMDYQSVEFGGETWLYRG